LKRWLESQNTTEEQLRKEFHEWLCPPDPAINYNTARDVYHDGTATWFIQTDIFEDWKASGSESFLWIHGKRMFFSFFIPFTLVDSCPLAG